MARLLFKKATGEVSIIDLKEGVNRLGRTSENDIQVEDDSVSSHHCELQVSSERIGVRDLHSTNGTFLDGQPIHEGWLVPGQTLRLGNVDLLLDEADAEQNADPAQSMSAPAAIPIPRPMTTSAVGGVVPDACPQHRSTPAQFICCVCGRISCPACVKTMQVGMRTFYACPACGKTAVKLSEYRKQNIHSDKTFGQRLPGVFAYPFRDYGALILVSGAIFFSLLEWGQNIGKDALFYGFVAVLILGIASAGYLFAFMKGVAVSAAAGEESPPSWPEFIDFSETFLSPFLQFLAILLLCIGPGVLTMMYLQPAVGIGLLIGGLFCLPMALLTVSMADSVSGLNPVVILAAIGKVPGPYLVVCGVFLATLGLAAGFEHFVRLSGIGVFGAPLAHFVSLYGATVQMRLLGALYLTNKERLGWFS